MLRVGVIGTGDERNPGPKGYGMAHRHAQGYLQLAGTVKMVACCDRIPERAERFAQLYGVANTYTDHQEMLAKEKLDIVSICTWPESHCQLTLDAVAAGVKAVHCEKPMAFTWGEAKKMAAESEKKGVLLTFNHQRRFGAPFRKAKALLDAGEIGQLQQIQSGVGDIYDYGSHNWDMSSYFNNHVPVKWVLAQIDYRRKNLVFDVHNENQAIAIWEYQNGVFGLMSTGMGQGLVGCHNRLIGSAGEIVIGPADGGPVLQIRAKGSGRFETIDCGQEHCHGPGYIERAIADVVQAVQTGVPSELCAANALKASEPMFASWESVRRRARVELPLDVDDNPLDQMVKDGVFQPE